MRMLDNESRQGPPAQRRAVGRVIDRVRAGQEVGEAMTGDDYFPPTLAAILSAGDESGKVDRALALLATHYQSRYDAQREFIRKITFPVLQLVAGIGVISLLIYVLGVITPMSGGKMPDILGFGLTGPTGVLKFWGFLALIAAFGVAAFFVWTRNVGGVQNITPLFYTIPKLGRSIQTITLSKFCTAMALAFEAGLDPIKSIRMGLNATGSRYYRTCHDEVETSIRGGDDLAGTLRKTHVFPDELTGAIEAAELSGTSAESLNYLAAEYERRAVDAVAFLATTASVLVRVLVMGVLIFMIFRVAMFYLGTISGAMEPILPRR